MNNQGSSSRHSMIVLLLCACGLVSVIAGCTDQRSQETSNLTRAEGVSENVAPVPRPGVDTTKEIFQPPIEPLSPQESKERIHLPEGYRLDLILSEPHIKEPVAIEFDGNGRMYVVEMRTYMKDVEGTGMMEPKSRVSVHRDTDDDGRYETHDVFLDDLVLPRMILALDDRLVVGETGDNTLYAYRDTDGDGTADQKTEFFDFGTSEQHVEHQMGGLLWASDNWIYSSCLFCKHNTRLRWTPDSIRTSPRADSRGQWRLTQDNYGKPWIVNAGNELGPMDFQQPIAYGAFSYGQQTAEDWRTVYPLTAVPDVQGGSLRVRKNNTLNHFTAVTGPDIYRGDRLPDALVGDILLAEPAGRLVRRGEIQVQEGVTKLRNVYPDAEFIRSTDPLFRPTSLSTAPDGTLYIVDMYRGLIEETTWVAEGSYLRRVVKKYQLDDVTGRGRIWRLRHEDFEPGPTPQMLDASAGTLVSHLRHPNGWWRDMAQRLLILREAHAVAPRLESMVRNAENHLARFHALWTLEGLGDLSPTLVTHTLQNDPHPEVRRAAIRAAERFFRSGTAGADLRSTILEAFDDPHPEVRIQVLLTADLLGWSEANPMIERAAEQQTAAAGLRHVASGLLANDKEEKEKDGEE